ncbi:hypothetical protein HID58_033322 [Brassica napus]|uniref:Uncharacterized protein n=1 Tax=Brassica napus TaxID=3708 RepID=A0ABQ8BYW7_BRANA|nr:hypothetical protein HID58_033322 [Brassica napus]
MGTQKSYVVSLLLFDKGETKCYRRETVKPDAEV